MRTLTVVPVQRLERAKSRLASVLPPHQRQQLVWNLVHHTLRVLRSVPAVHHLALLTPEPRFAEAARDWDAEVIFDLGQDLSVAVQHAQTVARRERYDALLIVLADLPLLTPAALARALALLEYPGVILAPDRRGTGTNLLALSPPDIISPAFGPYSRRQHRYAARVVGCRLRELWDFRVAFDLDLPEDLHLVEELWSEKGLLWYSMQQP